MPFSLRCGTHLLNPAVIPVPSKRDKHKRAKVTFKELGSFYCQPNEVESMCTDMQEDEPVEHTVEYVWMTDDEFDKLPDFQGF